MSTKKRKFEKESELAEQDSDHQTIKSSKKSSKKQSKKQSSDSDNENEKPVKKSSKKQSKKAASSESDSENEQPIMSSKPSDEPSEESRAFVDLGSKRRVTVSKFHGNVLIDIRQFYEKHGDMAPGNKGLSLSLQQWESLKRNVERIDKMIEQAK